MLKKLLLLTLLTLAPLTAQARMTPIAELPSGTYTLDKTHASVTWRVMHLGLSNYTARFTRMDATLEFDAKDPTKSSLVATVDPASVKTDFPNPEKKDFDNELASSKDWFNAGEFSEIKFVSKKIEKKGKNTGLIHGELTFMGVTKPLTLNATFNGGYLKKPFAEVPGLGFSATATLKRSQWGLATYVPNVGDDVQLLIEAEFHKAQ